MLLGRDYFFLAQNIIHKKKKKTLIHHLLDSPFHPFSPWRSFYRAFCETKYLDALVRAAIAHKRGWTRERTGSIAGAWPQGSTQSCIARHRKVFLLAYEIRRLRADITHLLSFVRAWKADLACERNLSSENISPYFPRSAIVNWQNTCQILISVIQEAIEFIYSYNVNPR